MALTKEYMEAVSQRNLLRVRIMLKDSLLVDTSFKQFDEMLNYAERKLRDIWIDDNEDEDVFSQSTEELNSILAGLVNHFSKRRVDHLKRMINKMYPPQSKKKQEKRETVVVINYTPEVRMECEKIRREEDQIRKICSQKLSKNKMDTGDLKELRKAAWNIVMHCNKITKLQESRYRYGNY